MTKWVAYTDGACAPSNPGPAAWGAVVIAPDGGEVAAHSGFIGHGTNQIAELTAAIEGLTRIPEGAAVELVSDSQYVLKGMTEWRAGAGIRRQLSPRFAMDAGIDRRISAGGPAWGFSMGGAYAFALPGSRTFHRSSAAGQERVR